MVVAYNFFLFISIFLGVMFVTLFERKILGLVQYRLGPNKVFLKGFIQSLSDALKLMFKVNFKIFFSSSIEYNFLPMGMLLLMMLLWKVLPNNLYDYNNNILMVLCLLSVGVYPIMFGSWFSGSFYSKLGSIRSIAQMVSYEVNMIMIIVSLVYFPKSFNLSDFSGGFSLMFVLMFFLNYMLMASFLVELGRSPADLLEGESELVSGFNTEYFGLKFSLVFLSEYGMVMFMGSVFNSMVFGFSCFSVGWGFFTLFYVILVYLVRAIMPRIRYDELMYTCWVSMLSMSLGLLVMNLGVILVM